MKTKQDPVAFAQGTIYELAHIRASVDMLSHFFIEFMAEQRGMNKEQFHAVFKAEVNSRAGKYFEHYSRFPAVFGGAAG